MKSLLQKHKGYFSGVYQWTFYIMVVIAFIERVLLIIESGFEGNLAAVIVQLVFFTLMVGFSAILGTLIWGTVVAVAGFVPYLTIRGLTKD